MPIWSPRSSSRITLASSAASLAIWRTAWAGNRSADLFGHAVRLDEVNWLADPLVPGDTTWLQCRYRARAVPALVRERRDTTLRLELTEPVRAITPGQSGVLYNEAGRLLGGGIIQP